MIEDVKHLISKEKVLKKFPNAKCTIEHCGTSKIWRLSLELESKVFVHSFVSEEYAWRHAEMMIDIKSNIK